MTYKVSLIAHLSDIRIVLMPDGTRLKLMYEDFYKTDITADIKGDYEDAYVVLHIINEDGVEAQL